MEGLADPLTHRLEMALDDPRRHLGLETPEMHVVDRLEPAHVRDVAVE